MCYYFSLDLDVCACMHALMHFMVNLNTFLPYFSEMEYLCRISPAIHAYCVFIQRSFAVVHMDWR